MGDVINDAMEVRTTLLLLQLAPGQQCQVHVYGMSGGIWR
jgi:hypothetical protein